jgi:histidinol-phosphate aminotransferase
MANLTAWVRSHIRDMETYEPILPLEVLSLQLGIPIEQIIKLDANENPYGPPAAALQVLSELPFLHIYPDPESRDLRAIISDFLNIPAANILAGAGVDELIDLLFRLFIDPGDRVLICPPTFGIYTFDAAVNAAEGLLVPRNLDFSLDVAAIQQAAAEASPKLIFIASPNNPDGSLLTEGAFEALAALPAILVLDEAYIEFAPEGSSKAQAVMARENLVVLRTFSKYAGLAGLRVGYGIFPSWIIRELWKIKQPYNVSVAASAAAITALTEIDQLEAQRRELIESRARLFSGLADLSYLDPYPSQANFILCRVLGRHAGELKRSLQQEGILVRYFDKPGLRDHIRISVGTPDQTDAVLTALARRE